MPYAGKRRLHLRMVEGEAVADDVDGADHVVERVLLEHGGGLLQRLGYVVGLDAEDDADVASYSRASPGPRAT